MSHLLKIKEKEIERKKINESVEQMNSTVF